MVRISDHLRCQTCLWSSVHSLEISRATSSVLHQSILHLDPPCTEIQNGQVSSGAEAFFCVSGHSPASGNCTCCGSPHPHRSVTLRLSGWKVLQPLTNFSKTKLGSSVGMRLRGCIRVLCSRSSFTACSCTYPTVPRVWGTRKLVCPSLVPCRPGPASTSCIYRSSRHEESALCINTCAQ